MSRVRLLLVDDDPDDLFLAEELLEEGPDDHDVATAATYQEGLRLALSGIFDICLVDHHLGARTALDFIAALVDAGVRTPVIVLTGAGELETDLEVMEAGAVDYLVKGRTSGEVLHRAIRYALRHDRTMALLERARERFALAVRGSNDGLWDWDLDTDEVFFSDRWLTQLGHSRRDVPSTLEGWMATIHPADRAAVEHAWRLHVAGGAPHVEIEYRAQHHDGSLRWMMARGVGVSHDGRPTRVVGSQTDIHRLKEVEQRLVAAATHDSLTGLPNRSRLMVALRRAIADGAESTALMLVGLDRLRALSVGMGTSPTDSVIQAVADRIRGAAAPGDLVAQVGEHEFAVLCTNLRDRGGIAARAELLRRAIELPVEIGRIPIQVRSHVGVVIGDSGGREAEQVLSAASVALAVARRMPGGAVSLFREEERRSAQEAVFLEGLMARAIQNGELRLEYQPIVDVRTRTVSSFEALARWRMDDGREVSPALFIPLAEQSGWIADIGSWCLREGCRAARRFREAGKPVMVSVNVSGHQLVKPDFRAELAAALAEAGISPRLLKLELTESVFLDHTDDLMATLRSIDELGVELVIDDFGTGYSCLAYLPTLPIGGLKIDRTFVRGLPEAGDQMAIVTAVATLAKHLGLSVVAEGVEREGQLDSLGAIDCDLVQGWMFSKAVPLRDAISLARFRYDLNQEPSSIPVLPNAS